jgi:hypothetical protein
MNRQGALRAAGQVSASAASWYAPSTLAFLSMTLLSDHSSGRRRYIHSPDAERQRHASYWLHGSQCGLVLIPPDDFDSF